MRLVIVVALLGGCSKPAPARRALADADVTAVGVNYCVSCELEQRGATTRCDFYGHHHALRIESATDDQGKQIPELTGETFHYLDSDESAALIDFDDFHDKRVRVKGRIYVRERTMAVTAAEAQ